jgi:hypothetical protein
MILKFKTKTYNALDEIWYILLMDNISLGKQTSRNDSTQRGNTINLICQHKYNFAGPTFFTSLKPTLGRFGNLEQRIH